MSRNYAPKTFLRLTLNTILKEYFRRKDLDYEVNRRGNRESRRPLPFCFVPQCEVSSRKAGAKTKAGVKIREAPTATYREVLPCREEKCGGVNPPSVIYRKGSFKQSAL